MQSVPDERPSLTRILSSRHSMKVSCESLSLSDAYLHNDLQFDTQSFYCSDDEKDHLKDISTARDADEATDELENPNYCSLASDYLPHVKALENYSGKLDNPSYGDDKAAGENLLSRFVSKVSPSSVASAAKEVERLRKHLPSHTGAIRRTGVVLPQSGPILLHIGSHSGAPNSRALATLRASSIIPRNAVMNKINNSVGEPSSPKVTCLGRVSNKQKHFGKCSSAASNDTKKIHVDIGCTSMLSRREKTKAGTEVLKKEKKTSRMVSANAMVGDHPFGQSKKTDCEKVLKKLTAQSLGEKGTMSSRLVTEEESKIWSLRGISMHEESKVPHQHQQSWQATKALALETSFSEIAVDLTRFGSESQRHHGMLVASSMTSLVGNHTQSFEQEDKEDFGQAPPQNALLFIRNKKANNQAEVASSLVAAAAIRNKKANDQAEVASSLVAAAVLPNVQETDDQVMNKSQLCKPAASIHRYDEDLLPLIETEMKNSVMIASSVAVRGASAAAGKSKTFQQKCSQSIQVGIEKSLFQNHTQIQAYGKGRPLNNHALLT